MTMMEFKIRDFARRRSAQGWTLTAEASTLGVAPGTWPERLVVEGDHERVEFVRQAAELVGPAHERELGGWWYSPRDVTPRTRGVLILVVND